MKHLTRQALEICRKNKITFSVKTNEKVIVVECVFPNKEKKYILFEDHRLESPHGGAPHICNHWHEGLGAPLPFTLGKEVTLEIETRTLQLASVMCLSKIEDYKQLKDGLFS
jgi:hypothetical protein